MDHRLESSVYYHLFSRSPYQGYKHRINLDMAADKAIFLRVCINDNYQAVMRIKDLRVVCTIAYYLGVPCQWSKHRINLDKTKDKSICLWVCIYENIGLSRRSHTQGSTFPGTLGHMTQDHRLQCGVY